MNMQCILCMPEDMAVLSGEFPLLAHCGIVNDEPSPQILMQSQTLLAPQHLDFFSTDQLVKCTTRRKVSVTVVLNLSLTHHTRSIVTNLLKIQAPHH